MHKLRYKLGLAILSLLAALGLAGGVAHADAEPGTADSNYSSTVQVDQPADSDSNITVTNTNSGTTTVGASSDGQSSTPAVTTTNQDGSGGAGTTTTGDPDKSLVQNAEQSNEGNAQPDSSVNRSDSNQTSSPSVGQNDQTPMPTPAQLTQKKAEPSAPVAPPAENKSQQPAPIPTNGTVAPVLIGSSGSTGRGFSAKTARLNVGLLGSSAITLLIFLTLVSGSFMAYLRRSRFRHAPRSDASVSLFSIVTPIQVQPTWATPVFFTGVNQATNTFKRGGEWI